MKNKSFYCRVKTNDDRRLWGYREAPTDELALSCFLQDASLSNDDTKEAWADVVDHILVARLLEYINPGFDPWFCDTPFTLSMVEEVIEAEIDTACVSYDTQQYHFADSRWHAARIRWIMNDTVSLQDPISIDNQCWGSTINPIPEILDGWHRFFAHVFLGKETIPVLYGGRIDLLKYLTGKRKTPPKE